MYDYLTKNGYEEVSKKFAKAILKKKILVVFAQIKFRVWDTLTVLAPLKSREIQMRQILASFFLFW